MGLPTEVHGQDAPSHSAGGGNILGHRDGDELGTLNVVRVSPARAGGIVHFRNDKPGVATAHECIQDAVGEFAGNAHHARQSRTNVDRHTNRVAGEPVAKIELRSTNAHKGGLVCYRLAEREQFSHDFDVLAHLLEWLTPLNALDLGQRI